MLKAHSDVQPIDAEIRVSAAAEQSIEVDGAGEPAGLFFMDGGFEGVTPIARTLSASKKRNFQTVSCEAGNCR